MELENTNIHLKSEKQLKMCDLKIFSAFVHRNELPSTDLAALCRITFWKPNAVHSVCWGPASIIISEGIVSVEDCFCHVMS